MAIPLKLWADDGYYDNDEVVPIITDTLRDNSQVVMHLGDTYEFLQTLPNGLAKLIITSPPYNVGQLNQLNLLVKASFEDDIFGEFCQMLFGLDHSISLRPSCIFVMRC